MWRKINSESEKYIIQNHWRRIWRRIVSALACVVVFCTVYALILPAITLEKSANTEIFNENITSETVAGVTVEEENSHISGNSLDISTIKGKWVDGGNLTDTVTWSLTEDDNQNYVLTISGTGAMVDYTSSNYMNVPWYSYRSGIKFLIIEDGITNIGAYSFNQLTALTGIKIGSDVKEIKDGAFRYAGSLTLIIPGTVEKIGGMVIMYSKIDVILEEGIKEIGQNFYSYTTKELMIPASVEVISDSIGTNSACIIEKFHVAEGNTHFFADDGVLFENSEDGNIKLKCYPRGKKDDSYTIPEYVTEIGGNAFRYSVVKHLTIPNTLKKPLPSNTFNSSSLTSVTIEEGVPAGTATQIFNHCNYLQKIQAPEGVFTGAYTSFCYNCINLEEAVISNATSISKSFYACKSLKRLIYNTADTANIYNDLFSETILPKYELIIGTDVDVLHGASTGQIVGFSIINDHAESVIFKGPNQITVKKGAFDGALEPLGALCGTLWVDEQGVVYSYDNKTQTAEIVYVSPGVTDVIVPATIAPEEGLTCKVTGVSSYAFQCATELEAVEFVSPENILSLSDKAFANCVTLVSVNGETVAEDAETTFSNASIGFQIFYHTGLTKIVSDEIITENSNGSDSLIVSKEHADDLNIFITNAGETMQWKENTDGTGLYTLLTGDSLTVNASCGNTVKNCEDIYRVYFYHSGSDCDLGILSVGENYSFTNSDGSFNAVCRATNNPDIICLDITRTAGVTMAVSINITYPNIKSSGGDLVVWGEILSAEDAKEDINVEFPKHIDTIQARWGLQPDNYELTHTVNASKYNLKTMTDGTIMPTSNLIYKIHFTKTSEASSQYGRDNVQYIDYVDVITLAEGVSWNDKILFALKAGFSVYMGNSFYAGDTLIATFSYSGTVTGIKPIWNEETQKLELHWRVVNNSEDSDIGNHTITITMVREAFDVDTDTYDATVGYPVHSHVDAVVRYYYTEADEFEAEAETQLIATSGNITLTNTATSATFFGESIDYALTLTNSGTLPYTVKNAGSFTLVDDLNQYLYIRPEDMDRMFSDTHGENLRIVIKNAQLAEWKAYKDINGDIAYVNSGNSDTDAVTGDITIAYVDGVLTVTDGTRNIPVGEGGLKAALQEIGYAVTFGDTYHVTWVLNDADTVYTLKPGETHVFPIYATTRDTFQSIERDWQCCFPLSSPINISNFARVYTPQNTVARTSGTVRTTVKREALLYKYAHMNDERIENFSEAKDGNVIDYELKFIHYGEGYYENLPMVDDLYGVQYLLVPAAVNTHLSGLNTYTAEDGSLFYILSEGEYHNVWVGTDSEGKGCLLAASIVVTASDGDVSGLHTEIKWYFSKLQASGNFNLQIKYSALVDMSLATDSTYEIGNVVWMNDRSDSRLTATIWGGGTAVSFGKEIMVEKDGSFLEKGVRYSIVREGDSVTYRLSLVNPRDGKMTVSGMAIADRLPQNYDTFTWEKNVNVSIRYEYDAEQVKLNGMDDWYLADEWVDVKEAGQQYILWQKSFSATFYEQDAKLYIYVTLTYPQDSEENATWNSYCEENAGNELMNTFYVNGYESEVTHDLGDTGQVLLQKGVYATLQSQTATNNKFFASDSRVFYSNYDRVKRYALYYVVLYNGGNTRLYMDTLYDNLPEGYTFTGLTTGIYDSPTNYTVENVLFNTYGGTNSVYVDEKTSEIVNYRSAKITAETTEHGVNFTISGGSDEYAANYDQELDKYYLAKGEAIIFGYICQIGAYAETEDISTNTIGMAYYDYLDTGVETGESIFTGTVNSYHDDKNDGNCLITATPKAYGLPGDISGDWLVSSVDLIRGDIVPGVTKYTDSYVVNGQTYDYSNGVPADGIVNWRIKFQNSGTASMLEYTLTDTMPCPYRFVGDVTYQIYNPQDSLLLSLNLFEVSGRTETGVYVVHSKGKTEFSYGAAPTRIWPPNGGDYFYLSFALDENGNEMMMITFCNKSHSIPEAGGYSMLMVASEYASTDYVFETYTNRAAIIPTLQSFEYVDQGTIVRQEDIPYAVANSSSVTLTSGFATSSSKKVEVTGDPENSASSTAESTDKTYVVLPDDKNTVTYTLSVTGPQEKPMEQIVIIDSLPDLGDHSVFNKSAARGSEFKIDFADSMNLRVYITDDSENPGEPVDPSWYTVEYSAKTEFDESDWNCTGIGDWSTDSTNARSIRLVMKNNSSYEYMPRKATVLLKFDAQISGEPDAGQIAWNSFGYRYSVKLDSGMILSQAAETANVGVRIATAPYLKKNIQFADGSKYFAEKDEVFTFIIREEKTQVCTLVQIPVAKGKSSSDNILLEGLKQYQLNTSGEWEATETDWTWTAGKIYTVTELDTEAYYKGVSINNNTSMIYSFTYNAKADMYLTAINERQTWNILLSKTDADKKDVLLAGAVFGLYSPKEEEKISEKELAEWTFDAAPETTLVQNGVTYYLSKITKSESDGQIYWTTLNQDSYLIKELQAPKFYFGTDEVFTAIRSNATGDKMVYSMNVANEPGYQLPDSGGSGAEVYYMLGGLIMLFAAIYMMYSKNINKKHI